MALARLRRGAHPASSKRQASVTGAGDGAHRELAGWLAAGQEADTAVGGSHDPAKHRGSHKPPRNVRVVAGRTTAGKPACKDTSGVSAIGAASSMTVLCCTPAVRTDINSSALATAVKARAGASAPSALQQAPSSARAARARGAMQRIARWGEREASWEVEYQWAYTRFAGAGSVSVRFTRVQARVAR